MNSGRFFWDYLLHRLTAKTRHGTHSPFVYRLLEQVVYAKASEAVAVDGSERAFSKADRLVIRLAAYYVPRKIWLAPPLATPLAEVLGRILPMATISRADIHHSLPDHPVDLAVLDDGFRPERTPLAANRLFAYVHPGTVVIVKGIYRSPAMRRLWKHIRERPDVTVTIDLFHTGLVFFHTGQARENFKIRY